MIFYTPQFLQIITGAGCAYGARVDFDQAEAAEVVTAPAGARSASDAREDFKNRIAHHVAQREF